MIVREDEIQKETKKLKVSSVFLGLQGTNIVWATVHLFVNTRLPVNFHSTPNKCSLYTNCPWIFRILKITPPKYSAKILIKSITKITIVCGSLFYRVLRTEEYFHGFCTNSFGFIEVRFIQNYEIASKATFFLFNSRSEILYITLSWYFDSECVKLEGTSDAANFPEKTRENTWILG